jgi:hypothetical protein
MKIMFGNLSAKQMCERLGIDYTNEIAEMEKYREEVCNKVDGNNVWHCYDIPLYIEVGTEEMADKWCELLSPVSHKMKDIIGIGG